MKARVRNERGDAATEVVLITPVLILLISVVISFGLWFHASQIARSASQEGVRAARLPGATQAVAEDTTRHFLDKLGSSSIANANVTAQRDEQVVKVEVKGNTASVIPGLDLPIHASSSASIESFRAAQ